jgi:hypothetical protein
MAESPKGATAGEKKRWGLATKIRPNFSRSSFGT